MLLEKSYPCFRKRMFRSSSRAWFRSISSREGGAARRLTWVPRPAGPRSRAASAGFPAAAKTHRRARTALAPQPGSAPRQGIPFSRSWTSAMIRPMEATESPRA